MKILILFDGTVHSRKALTYGIGKVREGGGDVTVLQVFDRSQFVDYDAGPGAEDAARKEAAAQLQGARLLAEEQGAGIPVRIISVDGSAGTVLADMAAAEPFDLVMVPQRLKTAGKTVTRPVFVVPGTILVPVDNSGSAVETDRIVTEARATGAKVLLLGVVPIHLFGKEEKSELAHARKRTEGTIRQLKKELTDQGVEAMVLLRSGYPDEEILAAAEEHSVSLILLPSGGATPSELSKAAAVLMDGPQLPRWPIALLPGHV